MSLPACRAAQAGALYRGVSRDVLADALPLGAGAAVAPVPGERPSSYESEMS